MPFVLAATAPRKHFGLRLPAVPAEPKPVLRWRGHVTVVEPGTACGATLTAPCGALTREGVYACLLETIAAWANVEPGAIENDEEGGFRLGGVLLAEFVVEPHYVAPFVPRLPLDRVLAKGRF